MTPENISGVCFSAAGTALYSGLPAAGALPWLAWNKSYTLMLEVMNQRDPVRKNSSDKKFIAILISGTVATASATLLALITSSSIVNGIALAAIGIGSVYAAKFALFILTHLNDSKRNKSMSGMQRISEITVAAAGVAAAIHCSEWSGHIISKLPSALQFALPQAITKSVLVRAALPVLIFVKTYQVMMKKFNENSPFPNHPRSQFKAVLISGMAAGLTSTATALLTGAGIINEIGLVITAMTIILTTKLALHIIFHLDEELFIRS